MVCAAAASTKVMPPTTNTIRRRRVKRSGQPARSAAKLCKLPKRKHTACDMPRCSFKVVVLIALAVGSVALFWSAFLTGHLSRAGLPLWLPWARRGGSSALVLADADGAAAIVQDPWRAAPAWRDVQILHVPSADCNHLQRTVDLRPHSSGSTNSSADKLLSCPDTHSGSPVAWHTWQQPQPPSTRLRPPSPAAVLVAATSVHQQQEGARLVLLFACPLTPTQWRSTSVPPRLCGLASTTATFMPLAASPHTISQQPQPANLFVSPDNWHTAAYHSGTQDVFFHLILPMPPAVGQLPAVRVILKAAHATFSVVLGIGRVSAAVSSILTIGACAAVQAPHTAVELQQWMHHHARMGVSAMYLMPLDTDATATAHAAAAQWGGNSHVVVDTAAAVLAATTSSVHASLFRAWNRCLLQHRRRHQWLLTLSPLEFIHSPVARNASQGRWLPPLLALHGHINAVGLKLQAVDEGASQATMAPFPPAHAVHTRAAELVAPPNPSHKGWPIGGEQPRAPRRVMVLPAHRLQLRSRPTALATLQHQAAPGCDARAVEEWMIAPAVPPLSPCAAPECTALLVLGALSATGAAAAHHAASTGRVAVLGVGLSSPRTSMCQARAQGLARIGVNVWPAPRLCQSKLAREALWQAARWSTVVLVVPPGHTACATTLALEVLHNRQQLVVVSAEPLEAVQVGAGSQPLAAAPNMKTLARELVEGCRADVCTATLPTTSVDEGWLAATQQEIPRKQFEPPSRRECRRLKTVMAQCWHDKQFELPKPLSHTGQRLIDGTARGGGALDAPALPRYALAQQQPWFRVGANHRARVVALSTLRRGADVLLVLAMDCERDGVVLEQWSAKCIACLVGDLVAEFADSSEGVVYSRTWDAGSGVYPYTTVPVTVAIPAALVWQPRLVLRIQSSPSAAAAVYVAPFDLRAHLQPLLPHHNVVACLQPLFHNEDDDNAVGKAGHRDTTARRLQEWMRHAVHVLGVDHVYAYDRSLGRGFRDELQPFVDRGEVTYVPWPVTSAAEWCSIKGYNNLDDHAFVELLQVGALQHCVSQHRDHAAWLLHADIDEVVNSPAYPRRGFLKSMLADLNYPTNQELTMLHMRWGGPAAAPPVHCKGEPSALLLSASLRQRQAAPWQRSKAIAPLRGLVLHGVHKTYAHAHSRTTEAAQCGSERGVVFYTSDGRDEVKWDGATGHGRDVRVLLDPSILRIDHMRPTIITQQGQGQDQQQQIGAKEEEFEGTPMVIDSDRSHEWMYCSIFERGS